MDTFGQILEMDEDEDDREFSKSIVYNFFEQASVTLPNIDKSMYVQHHSDNFHSLVDHLFADVGLSSLYHHSEQRKISSPSLSLDIISRAPQGRLVSIGYSAVVKECNIMGNSAMRRRTSP